MITSFSYSLSTIQKVLNQNVSFESSENPFVRTIATSSMECKTGSLFVPLKDKRDGHEFIPDAISRGASFFLCEKNHPILRTLSEKDKAKAILVSHTLEALGKLARFHRNRFFPLVIAVTGSSGKTSTKDLLGNLFQFLPKSEVVITEKNYNNEIGVPFTLFRINEKTRVVICEMGMNHRGEIERLSRIATPQIALITNVGSAHIEYLKKPEEIALEKADISLGLSDGGVLFVPENVEFRKIIEKKLKAEKRKLVFWKQSQSSRLKILETKKSGFLLSYLGNKVEWKLPGTTLLSNVRGMIEVAEYLKLETSHILKAISSFKAPDKRLNLRKGYFTLIDDTYNANPESMLSSVDASVQIAKGKELVWILGTMKELGKFSSHYHRKVGEFLWEHPEGILVTYGKDAREIVKARKAGVSFDEGEEENLIRWVQDRIPKGSVILCKGSRSMKMENLVKSLSEFKA
ncbi:UDP-N-acetylmuramoyl-tripeptide--D-alanyl-D-alanine ligase [Leptospira idonii]|uniref:UDP-N-acetylmuramoyl-tripeptide--D-alanyl-D-alanine ligase n=1 Tax=Leptospira idonii TaxID=1193500 RepID=A0A4R9LZ04_9LEPT|nr:UDP-N-acetylmuramoyl-tripeptide--D-alanyl-D-alanine ligase [Leptospira idonii]TGN18607.1 UDP-N-acetylmuramoyl-tripeptide--D-alanyl-D-alanine ligase [Leptospira idonii]